MGRPPFLSSFPPWRMANKQVRTPGAARPASMSVVCPVFGRLTGPTVWSHLVGFGEKGRSRRWTGGGSDKRVLSPRPWVTRSQRARYTHTRTANHCTTLEKKTKTTMLLNRRRSICASVSLPFVSPRLRG